MSLDSHQDRSVSTVYLCRSLAQRQNFVLYWISLLLSSIRLTTTRNQNDSRLTELALEIGSLISFLYIEDSFSCFHSICCTIADFRKCHYKEEDKQNNVPTFVRLDGKERLSDSSSATSQCVPPSLKPPILYCQTHLSPCHEFLSHSLLVLDCGWFSDRVERPAITLNGQFQALYDYNAVNHRDDHDDLGLVIYSKFHFASVYIGRFSRFQSSFLPYLPEDLIPKLERTVI